MSKLPSRRFSDSILSVDSTKFRWKIHREPKWSTSDGWRGLAIHVELADEPGRELIVELPFNVKTRRSTPQKQRPNVSSKELETHIRKAIEIGWDPTSRGKPFVLEMDES